MNAEFPLPLSRRALIRAVIALSLLLWISAGLVLALARPVYRSTWSLIVPDSETEARVNLQQIGQASPGSRSLFGDRSLDHRVDFKQILTSSPVRRAAAEELGIEWRSLNPRIRLVDQSSVLELQIQAPSAEEAQQWSWGLYEAFQERLSLLREDELESRRRALEAAVEASHSKAEETLEQLMQSRIESRLLSQDFAEEMAGTYLALRQERLLSSADAASSAARVRQMATNLGLEDGNLVSALTAISDQAFLTQQEELERTELELARNRHWGPNHPERRSRERQRREALGALKERAASLLGRGVSEDELRRLHLALDPRDNSEVFGSLVTALANREAENARLAQLQRQENELSRELETVTTALAQQQLLERRLNLAEAMYSSSIGKVDIGALNIFYSYPLVQMLTEPSLPDSPRWPKPVLILGATLVANLFLLVALFLALRATRLIPGLEQELALLRTSP